MGDSASDTSHDETKPAFYKISPEEMYKMKRSLEIMENRLGSLWIVTGRAHIDPILHEFEIVKASITEAEPASKDLTPEPSDFGSEPGPDKAAPAVCATLIKASVLHVLTSMIEQLRAQEDETSTCVADFMEEYDEADAENDGEADLLIVVKQAMEADPDFVKTFEIRAKKIISDFISHKMKKAFIKKLTEAFSNL